MRLPRRIFLTVLLIGTSIYFGLIWHGNLPRPNGTPVDTDNELDPATFMVGVAMAGMLWIDEIKAWLGRRRQ